MATLSSKEAHNGSIRFGDGALGRGCPQPLRGYRGYRGRQAARAGAAGALAVGAGQSVVDVDPIGGDAKGAGPR